jgi:hypothetical protein
LLDQANNRSEDDFQIAQMKLILHEGGVIKVPGDDNVTYAAISNTIFISPSSAGGLALSNLIQPIISLEMPVPSQGHYGFHSFPVVD